MLEESSSYSLADYVTSASAKGDVEVSEVDAEGKFIRLQNKGDKVWNISFLLSHRDRIFVFLNRRFI